RLDGRAAAVEEGARRPLGHDRRGGVLPRVPPEAHRPHCLDDSLLPRPLRLRTAAAARRRGRDLADHRRHVLPDKKSASRRHRPRRVRRRAALRHHPHRLPHDGARRVSARRADLLSLALLLALAALLFADVLFLGSNFAGRDLFIYHFPMKRVVHDVVVRGEFPWWNPFIAGGQPMAANPAYEVFYPPQYLIFLGSY